MDVLHRAKLTPVLRIAESLGEHGTAIWRILDRRVCEGMEAQDSIRAERVAVDETSSRKGHKYVTVLVDLDTRLTPQKARGWIPWRNSPPISPAMAETLERSRR
jgi:transposase